MRRFKPNLSVALREPYGSHALRADVLAGLTVAVVALPLSMAIAIACGLPPERGLYTAVFGGMIVSALGGSRFQIGGPAGAFIVLVGTTAATHGVDGLVLATFMSGFFLILLGFAGAGSYIRYVPAPVTIGFTAGIAVIILVSQLKDILGVAGPGDGILSLEATLATIYHRLPAISGAALAIASCTVAAIYLLRRLLPKLPAFLLAIAMAAIVSATLQLPLETIGTRFGDLPQTLPLPRLPMLSFDKMIAVLPASLSFAMLGAIESLLSAMVADSMSGLRHRSNDELVAQGIANMASAMFGGFCVTGTIARTATNVRAGAHGPLSGIFHSLFILGFILVAAPLSRHVPLAALSAVLVMVAWHMVDWGEIAALYRVSKADVAVVVATFLIVIFRDLTEGIVLGVAASALLLMHRLAGAVVVAEADILDAPSATDTDILVLRISGAFFFGAVASVASVIDRIGSLPKSVVIDVSAVPFVDTTAVATLVHLAAKLLRADSYLYVVGGNAGVRRALLRGGVRGPNVRFKPKLAQAVAAARQLETRVGSDRLTPHASATRRLLSPERREGWSD